MLHAFDLKFRVNANIVYIPLEATFSTSIVWVEIIWALLPRLILRVSPWLVIGAVNCWATCCLDALSACVWCSMTGCWCWLKPSLSVMFHQLSMTLCAASLPVTDRVINVFMQFSYHAQFVCLKTVCMIAWRIQQGASGDHNAPQTSDDFLFCKKKQVLGPIGRHLRLW